MERQQHQGASPQWQQGGRKIDLNNASEEELMTLTGVSEKCADQILSYRKEHGGFSSVDELKDVEGFSNILTDDFRAALTVGESQDKPEESGGRKH